MEFTDEQNAHISSLIDAAIAKVKDDSKTEIAGLNRKITELTTEKDQAKADADREAREKLDANGSVDDYKAQLKATEATLGETRAKLKELNFNNAIMGAISESSIRDDLRSTLTDSLMYRAMYDDATGQTTVDGVSPADYLATFLSTDQGKAYLRPSGSTGGGSTGGSGVAAPKFTKENMNFTEMLGLPEHERAEIMKNLGK